MSATSKDIAKRLGISRPSVTRILSNAEGYSYSEETRRRVLETAKEMNYHPNAVARGLSQGRMNILGVLMWNGMEPEVLTNSYVAGVLQGIFAAATSADYSVLLVTQSSPFVHDGRTDGILMISPPTVSPVVASLAAKRVPLVTISACTEEHGVPSVDVDNELGARLAIEHLLALGHRRIAHIMGSGVQLDAAIRLKTYCSILSLAGCPPPPEFIIPTDYSPQEGYEAARALLTLREPPTAIFAGNDGLALAAIEAARDMGISVPDQLSVVGFDDMPPACMTTPPLTTVKQPIVQIGKLAASLLISRLAGEDVPARTHLLKPELVVRGSTASV